MKGTLILEGGAEFQGAMALADKAAIALFGNKDIRVVILPTAAAVDNNHQRAGSNGVSWFKSLGVENVSSVQVIDQESANEQENAQQIAEADLIFILGGSPFYLSQALHATLCYQSLQHAYSNGKILCGSSAGAMYLCQYFFNPMDKRICEGLNLLPKTIFLPHHHKFKESWLPAIHKALCDVTIIGVDEETAILGRPSSPWEVYGKGEVNIYQADKPKRTFASGMTLQL